MLKDYLENDHNFDKKTMIAIFAVIIVFSGIFGFVYEFIFYYFNSGMKTFYYRGGNFLPWINIYAIGSVFIYLLTYKMRKKPWKVFFLSMLITGILELIAGYGLYVIGDGFRCWDYNTEILSYGNIGGFVCIRSVLIFGISSLLLMYIVVPLTFALARKLNPKKFFIVSVTICSIFLIDEIYNLAIARILSTPRASTVYKEIGFKYMEF